MPEARDWLFDAIWELSDKSVEMGFPLVARELEQAMDTCLIESAAMDKPVFQSRRRKTGHPGLQNFAPVAMDLFIGPRRGTKPRRAKTVEKRRAG